tara:strand:+ start:92 stop:280 length:189 start_codon:yes stop_codon:yes gene_type:complete
MEEKLTRQGEQLKRIADALEKRANYRTGEVTELRGIRNSLEEILRLVKNDLEAAAAYRKQND